LKYKKIWNGKYVSHNRKDCPFYVRKARWAVRVYEVKTLRDGHKTPEEKKEKKEDGIKMKKSRTRNGLKGGKGEQRWARLD